MKNTFKRIAAVLMAVMMLAAMAVSVSAATTFDGTNKVGFTLNLTKEENAYAPNTTYTFEIAAGSAVTGAAGQDAVYAGTLDEVKFVALDAKQTVEATNDDQLTITSTPADTDINTANPVKTLTYNCQIEIDTDKFEEPGIYRYTVTQTSSGYAGITYDSTPRTLDVYIAEDGDGFKVIGAVLYYMESAGEGQEPTMVKDGVFANAYDTTFLTVSKTVSGALGDTDKEFGFGITVTGAANEQYYVVFADGSTDALTSGTAATFTLADGESITVYGLSATDSYTVTEDDCTEDGYVTTVVADTVAGNTGSGEIDTPATEGTNVVDESVAFTNTKDPTIPTGIVMSVLPFVAMLCIAAVALVFFFQKKQRREA